jgi:transposase
MANKTDLMTVPMFAEKVGVNRFTVLKWVRSGKVKGFKKDPFEGRTSPIFIPVSELERVLKLMEGKSQGNGHSKSS